MSEGVRDNGDNWNWSQPLLKRRGRIVKSLFRNSKGFTLIELMVVITIMSILAGIVVPQLTGTTTVGKGAAKSADLKSVDEAVQRFVSDEPAGKYPVDAGTLPTTGTKPLDWNASFTSAGTTKYFSMGTGTTKTKGDYLKGNLKHATTTRDGDNTTGTVKGTGDLVNTNTTSATTKWLKTDDTTAGAGIYPVWRIDSTGKVYVNMTDGEY